MLSEVRFFGGSRYIQQGSGAKTHYLGTYEQRYVRVVDSSITAAGDVNLHTPPAPNFTEGGPIYVVSNGGSDTIQVKTRSGSTIGSIASGAVGFVFLIDRYSNAGDGTWAVAGQGTAGAVGDQASPEGFLYGNATAPKGIGLDLGEEDPGDQPDGNPELGFGTAAAIPVYPTPPL